PQTEDGIKKCYIQTYEDHLKFFADDPLTLPTDFGKTYTLNLLNPYDLIIYYRSAVWTLLNAYKKSRETKILISSLASHNQIIMGPLLYQEENGIKDLVSIIRAVRPHIRKIKSSLPLLEKAEGDLNYLIALDQAYQWREISLIPEIQEILKKALVKQPTTSKPIVQNEHYKEPSFSLPDISISQVPTIEKKISSSSPQSLELPSNSLQFEEKSEPQDLKQELTPPLSQSRNTRKTQQEKPAPLKHKVKTRPMSRPEHSQSLDRLFEEESPTERVRSNLNSISRKFSTSKDKRKEIRESSHSDEPSTSTPLTIHARQQKVLRNLLYGEPNTIKVDQSLRLLKSFGFIDEATSSQHYMLKAKSVEFWLEGKRILLDIPLVTLAVNHKGKRYFKPYVVNRLRKALLLAKFDKLLDEPS
ncbi:MAG: hypothetical protein IBJ00_01855, partial [Alphaproteobacteria bacterium]|nr:hypothetical protein [Alphaproteobacteria bacterium]